jgi:hypothetical protein
MIFLAIGTVPSKTALAGGAPARQQRAARVSPH